MKKIVYVVAGLAFFFVVALIALVLYLSTSLQLQKGRAMTAPARANRWPKKTSENLDLEGKSEDEINQALDDLNKKQNEGEV